ncbi:transposase [Chryseobacterium potabilaquae]|uniref:Uncharacterized protein n=1 Tax=Chryseobacterium potabilaquae TaxID=2675057 RepID=A0A6N4XDH5_9FLAO|nr:transposase [Chryseobacterium potabilaquae]CAA7196670.1 hypothetical protein CHRY9293_02746 [Chryseobacterium potabilaquae]
MIDNNFNFKEIHCGSLIKQGVLEKNIELGSICAFFKCEKEEVYSMYEKETLNTEIILQWSKLLEYNFFRIYSEHLILYSPQTRVNTKSQGKGTAKKKNWAYRKNIYTKGMIDFILEILDKGEKNNLQITQEYGIPKSTLNKWRDKYPNGKK